MPTDARQKMIRSATRLFRERGIEATTFAEVVKHSHAPRGSIYHHFPGGKAQLVAEATRFAGQAIADRLAAAVERDQDPVRTLRELAQVWRVILAESDYAGGCPVVAATVSAHTFPEGQRAAGAVFARWEDVLRTMFTRQGVAEDRARSLAALAIAALEGAILLARAQRDLTPLDRVADEVETAARHALAEATPRSRD
ncbi:transcriptional regulator [Longimycelium tulufanense]|uniref:Transcriptional regulator n=1 Tax=Longimycelium tulufanense TaxID=907463 RepID=A0A8J3FTW8_9PSEU|nr:TetR/AcrR family transcriptional regulator [Longimycelium tulufanense]GGM50165.1 transcriptional regulator [Longimycelium tulufanense]